MRAMLGGNNQGIRTIWGGGLNYNNIIGNKIDFTSNYFYNHYNPKTESQIQRQYILPDSSYFYNQNSLNNRLIIVIALTWALIILLILFIH